MCCLIILSAGMSAQNNHPYQYISPKPSTIVVSNKTNIILKHSEHINAATLPGDLIKVVGSKSGVHPGEFILSDDQ